MEENIELTPEEIENIKQLYEEEEKYSERELFVEPFPFEELERIDLSKLPLFEHTLKVFALALKDELFRIGIDIDDVEKRRNVVAKYKYIAERLKGDYFFVIFKVHPLPSYGALAFKTEFLLALVSLLLGGRPDEYKVKKNVITQTEYKILEKFFITILKAFEKELSKLYKVKVDITGTDTDKFLSKVNLTEKQVLIAEFIMKFSPPIEDSYFYLIIDEETIEPLVNVFMGSGEGENYKKAIWKNIKSAEVLLKVILHGKPQTLENILDWKKGDLIILEEFANKPIKAYIDDYPVMEGYLGKHQGFYALLFKKWFKE